MVTGDFTSGEGSWGELYKALFFERAVPKLPELSSIRSWKAHLDQGRKEGTITGFRLKDLGRGDRLDQVVRRIGTQDAAIVQVLWQRDGSNLPSDHHAVTAVLRPTILRQKVSLD